ncbi:endoribonuclease YbeY isoform X2 [Carassius auratus]|uniref:Endoribonuclease YbeY isoform X2 n=1 Tax=Carassius auratus TaxID=7957 RepID=A0A6P6Q484_CARAU|nr:endoribonuclease YbeY isoform X2 [Carassius auratus]
MGVVLRNLQSVVPLRRARLRRDVEVLRHIFGVQRFDLGIICVDNRRIQHINNLYRKNNQPTDVLSFPFYEVVTAHGICHLLGYRHETEEEWIEMQQKESYILSEFNRLTGSHLEPLTKRCT